MFIINILINPALNNASLNLLNKNSSIKISSGSSLTLDSPISSINGKIIKDSDANVSGADINFSGGSYYDGASKIKVDGSLSLGQTNKIILNGNKTFEGKRGEISQNIFISGLNNLLQGVLFTSDDINLQDSLSEVSIAIRNRLDSNINLNSGSLKLEGDLFFLDYKRMVGPGKVYLNGHKLSFGATDLIWSEPLFFDSAADIELNANTYLQDTWSFSGDSVLSGNSNIISSLCSDGIVLRPNSNLLIKDTVIYGLSGSKIRCLTDDSTITLQNVKCMFDEDFTFSRGALIIVDNVEFLGNGKKFIYQSSMTTTIKDNSILTLGNNFTFSYDPISNSKKLLEFEALDSSIFLNGGNLYSSSNGLNLEKGSLVVGQESNIIIEEREWVNATITDTYDFDGITYTNYDYTYGFSGGISFGNNISENDFKVNLLSGVKLNINNGTLYYKNVNLDSYNASSELSCLKINSGAYLNLEQTLDVSNSRIVLAKPSCLIKTTGKYVLGPAFYSK